MRITFMLPVITVNGGIRVAVLHAASLARRGHQVVLVSPSPPLLALRSKLASFLRGHGWPAAPVERNAFFDGIEFEHRQFDRRGAPTDDDVPDADVIVATWWETAEWVARLAPSKGAKVHFIQGIEDRFPFVPADRVAAVYRLPCRKIGISRFVVEHLRREFGVEDVDIVPNSVDRQLFFAPQRAKQAVPTLGFLYAHSPLKGTDVAVRAVTLLKQRFPALRVLAFGAEPVSAVQPLPGFVEFERLPRQERIRDIYAQCDVWLSSSKNEGFNLVALEAMVCRTPLVSTRTGWPIESVVDGVNGYLVEVDDAAAMADRAQRVLLLEDTDWLRMSAQAHAAASQGDWEDSHALFEAALLKAVAAAN